MGESTKTLIARTKELYKSIGSVRCKALKTDVVFNRHGYNHLLYDGGGKRRLLQSLRQRLHLFPYAEAVVRNSNAIISQERREIKVNGIPRIVTFYEIAYCDKNDNDVTVIVRQFEIGSPHYFSIRKTKKPR